MKLFTALLFCLISGEAFGQAAVQQYGTIVPYDLPRWARDHQIEDAGGLQGKNGRGVNPFTIFDQGGDGVCTYDKALSGPYSRLCLGHDKDGNAVIKSVGEGGDPAGNINIDINGTIYPLVQKEINITNNITGSIVVADNAALKALSPTTNQFVVRNDFRAGGGAPPLLYSAYNAPCPTPDNGAQVSSNDGKCWIANIHGTPLTPMIWGCYGDGVTDDSACFATAANAVGSARLSAGRHFYRLNTGYVATNDGFEFVCEARFSSGLVAGSTNETLMFLNGNNQAIRNCFIDMSGKSTILNSSGVAVLMGIKSNSVVEGNLIYGHCIGIDVNGNNPAVRNNRLTAQNGGNHSACHSIRVGANTISANTVDPHIDNNLAESWGTSRHDSGLLILDAGGAVIGTNDFLGSDYGTIIAPEVQKQVLWLTATGTYLGDTNKYAGLLIDTGANATAVWGASFNQTWTSSATAGSGVVIKNTNAAYVQGISFVGHRSFNNSQHGFYISGGPVDVTIDSSMICNNSEAGPQAFDGINLGAGASKIQIRNNRIASLCSGGANNGSHGFGINLENGSNSDIMIEGNNLTDPQAFAPVGGTPSGASIITNNLGIDNVTGPTTASAASINLNGIYPHWHITGTTNISSITGAWGGRLVQFISDSGALPFTTGGGVTGICNNFTTTGIAAIALAQYDLSAACWRMH